MNTVKQIQIVSKKEFKTLSEVIQDERFEGFLKASLGKLKNRKNPPAGKRYKRGPINTLREKGLFNTESFVKEFETVLLKKSNLPSSARSLMSEIMSNAVQSTIHSYLETKE